MSIITKRGISSNQMVADDEWRKKREARERKIHPEIMMVFDNAVERSKSQPDLYAFVLDVRRWMIFKGYLSPKQWYRIAMIAGRSDIAQTNFCKVFLREPTL